MERIGGELDQPGPGKLGWRATEVSPEHTRGVHRMDAFPRAELPDGHPLTISRLDRGAHALQPRRDRGSPLGSGGSGNSFEQQSFDGQRRDRESHLGAGRSVAAVREDE